MYDSGCARFVMGYNMTKMWAALFRRCTRGLRLRCQRVSEKERFRFGAGDPVWSMFAALVPICIGHRLCGILARQCFAGRFAIFAFETSGETDRHCRRSSHQ
eukprot:6841119-Pyramimonas_sp.AAC.2